MDPATIGAMFGLAKSAAGPGGVLPEMMRDVPESLAATSTLTTGAFTVGDRRPLSGQTTDSTWVFLVAGAILLAAVFMKKK